MRWGRRSDSEWDEMRDWEGNLGLDLEFVFLLMALGVRSGSRLRQWSGVTVGLMASVSAAWHNAMEHRILR